MSYLRRLRRHRAALFALLCVAAGVVLILIALDANTWGRTVKQDDLRFRALPSHRGLWKPSTRLPGDPAGLLLDTSDTIAYRRGLQFFLYSRIGLNPEERQDLPTIRAEAQQQLLDLVSGGKNSHERSYAANLLGVLVVTTPTSLGDQGAIMQILHRSADYFSQAIRLDPANVDAKLNLELVLRLTRPAGGKFGRDAKAGYGFGKGRGVTPIGKGY